MENAFVPELTRAPTWVSRDVITPVHRSRHMAEVIPDAELVILDGCGHMAPFERHEDVTAHIRKFADKVLH